MTRCERSNELLSVVAFKQITIAGLGHPFGARQMACVNAPGALFLLIWIESEDDPGNLPPIGAVRIGIEQPKIGDLVDKIIFSDLVRVRRVIEQIRSVQCFLDARFVVASAYLRTKAE